jgi:hypothetical protein
MGPIYNRDNRFFPAAESSEMAIKRLDHTCTVILTSTQLQPGTTNDLRNKQDKTR